MKRYVKAMSYSRKDIASTLDNEAYPLINHLIKFYNYPDNQSHNHWIEEIYSVLHHVPAVKSNNKLPSKEFIYNNIWNNTNQKRFPVLYKRINEDYDSQPRLSVENTMNVVTDYIKWLSEQLSENDDITLSDVRNYLSK